MGAWCDSYWSKKNRLISMSLSILSISFSIMFFRPKYKGLNSLFIDYVFSPRISPQYSLSHSSLAVCEWLTLPSLDFLIRFFSTINSLMTLMAMSILSSSITGSLFDPLIISSLIIKKVFSHSNMTELNPMLCINAPVAVSKLLNSLLINLLSFFSASF